MAMFDVCILYMQILSENRLREGLPNTLNTVVAFLFFVFRNLVVEEVRRLDFLEVLASIQVPPLLSHPLSPLLEVIDCPTCPDHSRKMSRDQSTSWTEMRTQNQRTRAVFL